MFFPFITGKGFIFRLIVGLISGAFATLFFVDSTHRPKLSWITKSVLLFTGAVLLTDLLGVNVYKSIWSNYERMEGFVLILHLMLYYIVLSSFLDTKKLWDLFLNTNIGAGLLMSLYGLLQITGNATINQGGTRVDGTFGNAAYLAIYLVFNIFLCLYLALESHTGKWKKWGYLSIAVLETVVLYFTATRGAILGLIGGLFVTAVLVLWKERENKYIKNIARYAFGVLVVFLVTFFLIRDTDLVRNSPVLSRFSNLSFSEFKTQGRYFVWPMALKGIAENPIFGWGQENFNFVFNKNYNPKMFGQEEWFDRTHNVVLDWLIAGGIVGFVSYASMYVALFYYIWRKSSKLKSSEKSVLTGMIVAYIFHNMFVFDNLISYIMFFNILALVHYLNKDSVVSHSSIYTKKYGADVVNYVAIPSVVLFTLIFIYYVNVPAISANRKLIKAMSQETTQIPNVDDNIKYFKEVFAENSFGSTEAVEQVVTYATQVASWENLSIEKKQELYDLAKLKLVQKIDEVPNDVRYLVFAGSFYNRFGQYDEAIKYLERALQGSPLKQTIHFELGSSYLSKGNPAKMFELFKKAYDLKPESRESQVLYAIAAIYNKDIKVVTELDNVIPEETVMMDNRFYNTYMNIGDYNSALSILNARLQKDPTSVQNKLTLASFYVKVGQKQNAIAIIRQMITENPAFKAEGESYIQQIQNIQ